MTTPAENVIDAFGGLRALADALGHKHVSTVQGWKERGVIPLQQIPVVRKAAEARGIDLPLETFIPHEPEQAA